MTKLAGLSSADRARLIIACKRTADFYKAKSRHQDDMAERVKLRAEAAEYERLAARLKG